MRNISYVKSLMVIVFISFMIFELQATEDFPDFASKNLSQKDTKTQVISEFPKDIPKFPTLQPKGLMFAERKKTWFFSCSENMSKVVSFYCTKLAKNGWKVKTEISKEVFIEGKKKVKLTCCLGKKECNIYISGNEKEAEVAITEYFEYGRAWKSTNSKDYVY